MLRLNSTLTSFLPRLWTTKEVNHRFMQTNARNTFHNWTMKINKNTTGICSTFWIRRWSFGDFGSGFLVWKLMKHESRLSLQEAFEHTFHALAHARATNNAHCAKLGHYFVCHFPSSDCIYAVLDSVHGITALYKLCSSGISKRTRQLSCPAKSSLFDIAMPCKDPASSKCWMMISLFDNTRTRIRQSRFLSKDNRRRLQRKEINFPSLHIRFYH